MGLIRQVIIVISCTIFFKFENKHRSSMLQFEVGVINLFRTAIHLFKLGHIAPFIGLHVFDNQTIRYFNNGF